MAVEWGTGGTINQVNMDEEVKAFEDCAGLVSL